MPKIAKTSQAVAQLEKMYKQLNKDFFGGKLEDCVITVQSSPFAHGHVTVRKVWHLDDSTRYELNMGAESLIRPIQNVTATLLHEMVHVSNMMDGIQDTSRGYTYHNKRFKEKAESVLLVVEHDSRIGWSITSPSPDLIAYVMEQKWQDFDFYREKTAGRSTVKGKGSTSSTRKYVCPVCGTSYRATRDLHAVCGECWYTLNRIVDMEKA